MLQHFAVRNTVCAQGYPFRKSGQFISCAGGLQQVSFLFQKTEVKMLRCVSKRMRRKEKECWREVNNY